MKTKINLNKRDYWIIVITLTAGLFFGWLFFHGSKSESASNSETKEYANRKETIWTCSMHPQIRMDHPGKCPICGMDLIPLQESPGSESAISTNEIQMTDAAMKIANIQTMTVKMAYAEKEVYLLGRVKPDERNIAEMTARFGGRIEKLYVNFTGQNVSKGEKLAAIYSPDLITAQKELLEAQEYKRTNPDFYKATRNKLKLWDITDKQIDNIEQYGEPQSYFDVLSPISGTVTKRYVTSGDYIKEGIALFQVIDLTRVWVMFEAYESDLPWITTGDKINFTIQSIPGENFTGQVSFIDPIIDQKTRIANVRVEMPNPGFRLKPDMFANGMVTSTIAGNKKDLMIPKTAVLWTGKRAVVYVKVPGREQPTFKYREITLGPSAGEFYAVYEGLQEGEEIAVNGVFKIDASAQLAGKPSMMNPEGGKISTGHDHGNMEMESSDKENSEHPETDMKLGKMETEQAFRHQLTEVYNSYLKMKDAFVASDPGAVRKQSKKVKEVLKKVDMKLLEGDAHLQWMSQLDTLNNNLDKISDTDDIEVQRIAFAGFNNTFHQSIKRFGLYSETTYYQYCPMAISEKGPYWFSSTKEIKNPYFGNAMLTCGETREIIYFQTQPL